MRVSLLSSLLSLTVGLYFLQRRSKLLTWRRKSLFPPPLKPCNKFTLTLLQSENSVSLPLRADEDGLLLFFFFEGFFFSFSCFFFLKKDVPFSFWLPEKEALFFFPLRERVLPPQIF